MTQISIEQFQLSTSGTHLDSENNPYTALKKRVLAYRLAFAHIAAVLILMALVVFVRSPNWVCDLYVGHCLLLKGIVGSFSGLLGLLALSIGWWMRTEGEASMKIWVQSRRRLLRTYRQKLETVGGATLWVFPKAPERAKELNQTYLMAKAALHDLREQNKLLISQIARSRMNAASKESLFNEALRDYQQASLAAIETFALHSFQSHPSSV